MALISTKGLKSRAIKTGIIASSLSLLLFTQGCSDMKEVVLNRAVTTIDGHEVVIQPCRNSYSKTINDTPTERNHMFGCGDKTKVELKNEELKVNGKYYGTLGRGDNIIVRHDKVFINQKEAVEVAMK